MVGYHRQTNPNTLAEGGRDGGMVRLPERALQKAPTEKPYSGARA